jgi:hypothetical protein
MPYKSRTEHGPDGQVVFFMERGWARQRPPFSSPLPFGYDASSVSGSWSDSGGNGASLGSVDDIIYGAPGREDYTYVTNTAYGKFVDQTGNPAQWANNLLEANQAVEGAAARLLQIARFASALRKGHLGDAATALKCPIPSGLKGKKAAAKNFGDQFLEFHFGWVPLAQDIHNSMETLSKPNFGKRKLHASCSYTGHWHDRNDSLGGGFIYTDNWERNAVFRCKMGATVRVSNPNAYLASQMGLVNPASVLWEAVPYSFVADWFGNVGQVLASATDFVGLDVESGYTTTSGELHVSYWADYRNKDRTIWYYGKYGGKKFNVSRTSGIAGPTVALKPFKGLSLTRGVTAISLLLQKL